MYSNDNSNLSVGFILVRANDLFTMIIIDSQEVCF